ncbi:MAG: Ig-like domain-containing protein [Prevotella sp.]|nr:Ig-like domain-containing protein [Prevotella sp.]
MRVLYNMKSALLLMAAMLSFGTAMAETGTETEADQQNGNKNVTAEGISYYIDGGFIAGTGSAQKPPMTSKGLKFRTGTSGGTLTFTVRPNYTVTRLYMAGVGNYVRTDASIDRFIDVTKVEVDGVEVPFTGGHFPDKNSDVAAELFVENIAATETITLYFDNSNAEGTQINASWAIDWSRPDASEPTITVSPAELSLIPGETYQLNVHVDPASFTTHWVSELPELATVSETGLVTAIESGACTISNVWDDDESVYGSMQLYVNHFNPTELAVVKEYNFAEMGDITLTLEEEACGAIWNEGNKKVNNVFFCTNEGLENIAVQAALSGGKGWSIVAGEGLKLASGAGRCAAIKANEGEIVEIFYTGNGFYTGSHVDPIRPDDGAEKTAINQGIGHAIYGMVEDGLLGFELDKGNSVSKIVVYANDITDGISEMAADAVQAPVYNLQGVRVVAPKNGLFIQNGRKFVVK